jgi:glycerol-3-phosphate O-acyltransferase
MQGAVVIRFGKPLDLFGNHVDPQGRSYDRRGREVDPASYVRNIDGKVVVDANRDVQYARELGEAICMSYANETVIMSTHVVAAVCFELLRRAAPANDLFTVLRQRDSLVVPRDDLAREVVLLRDRISELEKNGKIRMGAFLRTASGGDILERAIRAFAGYHTAPVLTPREDGIALSDTNLLFYYQNRLAVHGLAWDVIAPPGTHSTTPHLLRPRPSSSGASAEGGAT